MVAMKGQNRVENKRRRQVKKYCEMCRKYKIMFGGSTCSSQIISLTKQKQNLYNLKKKVYHSAGILCQGTHNVIVVVVFANVICNAKDSLLSQNGTLFSRV